MVCTIANMSRAVFFSSLSSRSHLPGTWQNPQLTPSERPKPMLHDVHQPARRNSLEDLDVLEHALGRLILAARDRAEDRRRRAVTPRCVEAVSYAYTRII